MNTANVVCTCCGPLGERELRERSRALKRLQAHRDLGAIMHHVIESTASMPPQKRRAELVRVLLETHAKLFGGT